MDDAAIIKLFEPLYSDTKPETQFAHKKPLLAHYTTIQTIEKIISSKELWFSNPLYMNDLEEVRFGLIESDRILKAEQSITDACATPARKAALLAAFDHYSRHYIENHLTDTYVFCLSEHEPDNNDGLLSMWRGYGGSGNGAAIVFDTAKLNTLPTSPLIVAQVEYGSGDERRVRIESTVKSFASILGTNNLPDDKLHLAAHALLERFKVFALFSKHRGFHEEREWRVVYMRDRDRGNAFDPFLGFVTGPNGIEAKLKFKVGPVAGATADDLSLSKIVSRIILGPTISSPMAVTAFRRMLFFHGEMALIPCLVASSIPFRSRI
jgi:Protein of unknown function (DUF2971)